MLKWTVCKNCGMILDDSQKSCLNCQGDVENVNMDYLRNYLNNLNFLLKTLNIFTPYCTSTKDMGNLTLESIIVDDLFKYFSYLSLGDNKITDNEVEFINSLLNTNFSKEDILTLTDDKLAETRPPSFECLKEVDEYCKNFDMNQLNSCGNYLTVLKCLENFL